MSNPRVDKLHLLGRMLRTEESRVNKLLQSDRLNVSEEAKDFSRAIIEYSDNSRNSVTVTTINNIFNEKFSNVRNTDEFKTIAEIISEEFIAHDEN